MLRSYLFVPGHRPDVIAKALATDADAVIVDLEDAVPLDAKEFARRNAAEVLAKVCSKPIFVRVNTVKSDDCESDLKAIGDVASLIRVPKVESAEDLRWVAAHAPKAHLHAALETASGVMNAFDIAMSPSCAGMSIGGLDMRRDLGLGEGFMPMLWIRSSVVVAARAALLPPPVDSVYPAIDDDEGLQTEATHARSLGMFGKAAVHPRQLAPIHAAFTPSAAEIEWAYEVIEAFSAAGGAATTTRSGELVDVPVAARAEAILTVAAEYPS